MLRFHLGVLKRHYQWEAAQSITQILKAAGHQALLAGGCVRDGLMGRRPNDLDVATSATPDQVEALFPQTVGVGKQFGVIRVLIDGGDIEVATFRKDGPYLDGRRPQSIEFSRAEEDAKRRDYTINALFYDIQENKVYDYVGGIDDIDSGLLRTVGDPFLRFEEDKLRILRALRFVGQLGFVIDPMTYKAIQTISYKIRDVSGERIQEELHKLWRSPFHTEALALLKPSGLEQALFSGLQRVEWLDVPCQHLWQALVLYFKGVQSRNKVEEWIHFLRLSNQEKRSFFKAWELLQAPHEFWKLRKGARLALYGQEATRFVCQIWAFEGIYINDIQELHIQWLAFAEVLPVAKVRGDDLAMFFKGQTLGRALQLSYEIQLENNDFSKDEIIHFVKGLMD